MLKAATSLLEASGVFLKVQQSFSLFTCIYLVSFQNPSVQQKMLAAMTSNHYETGSAWRLVYKTSKIIKTRRKKFLESFISGWDRPVKSTETTQGQKST